MWTALVVVGLVAAACGTDTKTTDSSPRNDVDDFKRNAEQFIESTEVESQAGTTFTKATCTSPDQIEAGERFTCTAVDADGATWDFNLIVKSGRAYEIANGEPRPQEPAPTTQPSTTQPSTTTQPLAPIVFSGTASTNSAPTFIPAGDYKIVFDYGGCPIAGGDLRLTKAPDDITHWVDAGTSSASPGETYAYGVAEGEYFASVYSCPEVWTITLTSL